MRYTLSAQPSSNTGVAQSTSGPASEHINIQARVLDVRNLHLSSTIEDGAELARLYDAENAVAWKIARTIDPTFSVSESTFLAANNGVPLSSFENYIRGTDAPTAAERLHRLTAATTESPNYAAALLALGREQYEARDYASAASTLGRVAVNSPLWLEANFYVGLSLFNAGRYPEAQAAFARVAAKLPLPEVQNDIGVAAARQGGNGSSYFQQALSTDPRNEDIHYNLAVASYRARNLPLATTEVDAALKLKPADSEASELRSRIRLAAAGQAPAAAAGSDLAFMPTERILRTYSETAYRQAAFQIEQMQVLRLGAMPAAERVSEYNAKGEQYLSQGRLPEAEQQFGRALAVDSNSAAAHAGMAQVRLESGNLAEARQQAITSNSLRPSAAAWITLGRLDLAANQLPAAMSDVEQALKLEPRNAAALNLQAAIAARQGGQR